MAGSFNHVVEHRGEDGDASDGRLRERQDLLEMLEARGCGDVYEAIEEMYGMIWVLAASLAEETHSISLVRPMEMVQYARENYKLGLALSPTPRFHD